MFPVGRESMYILRLESTISHEQIWILSSMVYDFVTDIEFIRLC